MLVGRGCYTKKINPKKKLYMLERHHFSSEEKKLKVIGTRDLMIKKRTSFITIYE